MGSTTAIRSRQLVFLLIISRITFSYSYISAISPGNDVQDILLAVPVVFGIDLIIFAPALMLLKRYPGRDLVDCAWQITGSGLGSIIGFFYYLYFTAICVSSIILFQQFYNCTISSDINGLIITVPMLIAAVYGAVKGIESISRFGLFVFVIYLLVSLVMYLSVLPDLKMDYLRPLLYNGPRVFFIIGACRCKLKLPDPDACDVHSISAEKVKYRENHCRLGYSGRLIIFSDALFYRDIDGPVCRKTDFPAADTCILVAYQPI